jgi:hypothetical protein
MLVNPLLLAFIVIGAAVLQEYLSCASRVRHLLEVYLSCPSELVVFICSFSVQHRPPGLVLVFSLAVWSADSLVGAAVLQSCLSRAFGPRCGQRRLLLEPLSAWHRTRYPVCGVEIKTQSLPRGRGESG